MNGHDDVPPALRHLYDAAPDTATPSDVARERTVSALRRRGLLRRRRSRSRAGIMVAALFLLAFAGGFMTGRGTGRANSPSPRAESASPSGPGSSRLDGLLAAAEEVQGTGTDHALALAGLAGNLVDASDAERRTARAIVRAAAEAQAAPTRLLLGSAGTAAADSVVWF